MKAQVRPKDKVEGLSPSGSTNKIFNMKCKNCGKEHDGSYGSGVFCCAKCARSFSSKHNKHKTKIINCSNCGKSIEIPINSRTKMCNECIDKINPTHHKGLKKCSICGSIYSIKNGCQNNFCKTHNIQQLKTLIKYFGFDKSKLGTGLVEDEFMRIKNMIYDLYINKHICSSDICKMFGYPNVGNFAPKVLRKLGIKSKTNSEATIENYLNGKLDVITPYQYKQEWHTTWDGKEVYLRSSYEIDFANELDNNHIKYDVECFRIKYFNTSTNDYRCTIPDFYLIDSNTIVEIKSSYTLDIQEMKDKARVYKELGYNFKLILEHEDQTNLIMDL